MIQLATVAQLGVANFAPPPHSFDCITIMIVDHLLTDFAIKEKIPNFYFGASRTTATGVAIVSFLT